ncbi:hypothetical protein GOV10_06910 [Candidatus Woesearchaeota archaeon]|nr:hypothetical protein [Candidatus Woesearchaeota archaeon]
MKLKNMVVGTILAGLVALPITQAKYNAVGRAVDYLYEGSRVAEASDYPGTEYINEVLSHYLVEQEEFRALSEQLQECTDVTREMAISYLKLSSKAPGIFVGENNVTIRAGPHEFMYIDDNKDGFVESFGWDEGNSITVDIHSQGYWNKEYAPRLPLHESQLVMEEDLQTKINNDYKMFRAKGTKTKSHITRGFIDFN